MTAKSNGGTVDGMVRQYKLDGNLDNSAGLYNDASKVGNLFYSSDRNNKATGSYYQL
ncbi:MAG: hypothetical protein IH840_14005 [Candidatus Heimdallarchaeota archaeon]|nr:hypothetical protein [Candidatus Heimdallarchaeota archaeon]